MKRQSSTPPDLPGYTAVKLLGSGGFSDVFLYDQELPRRRVAVKVLLTEQLNDSTRAQFVAEANLMAQLSNHPFIVTIFHADVAGDDRPYFVMEYCSGPSLAERYKRERFAVDDALRTGVRLASAIATAHGAGILHRDIKPANVLTNDYGWPALTDFGISSSLEDELPVHTVTRDLDERSQATANTGSAPSVGMSVPWSPPEMFLDEPQPDVRSDVFSLAATLHTLLAGQTPFEVRGRPNGTLDLIGRIERGVITPIDRDDIPRSLLAVLAKGMAPNRADRYASAIDFARALQRVELELGYAPTSIDVPALARQAEPRTAAPAGEDETRVRTVQSVQAQGPVAPASAPALPPTPPQAGQFAPVEVGTVLRSPRLGAEDAPEVVHEAPPAPALPLPPATATELAPRQRRTNWWAIGISVAAILAILVTVIAIALGTPSTELENDPVHTGAPIVGDVVPSPKLPEPATSADGSVTFTVTSSNPQDGDQFRWSVVGSSDKPLLSADGVITVPASEKVCINVWLQRSGKLSPEPLEACYP